MPRSRRFASRDQGATWRVLALAMLLWSAGACGGERSGVPAVPAEVVVEAPRAGGEPSPAAPPTPPMPGTIRQILAVDAERAVIVFTPDAPFGDPLPILALVRRDGSVAWSAALEHHTLGGRTSTGVEIVGDAVSVAVAEHHDRRVLHSIVVFALADGRRRGTIELPGKVFLRETLRVDRERYDVVGHWNDGHTTIVATGAKGQRWRRTIETSLGAEIVASNELVAVHESHPTAMLTKAPVGAWHVLSRRDGRTLAEVPAEGGTCFDGRRWFVLGTDEVLEVDRQTFSTRTVMRASQMAAGRQQVTFRDCVVVDGRLAAFVQRGMTEGLVTTDPRTGAVDHFLSLGVRRIRDGAIHPLPNALPPVIATLSDNRDAFVELGVGDIRRASATLTTGPRPRLGAQRMVTFEKSGEHHYVVSARGLIATIDGDTGAIVGRHRRKDTMRLHRSQLVGGLLWLPPPSPTRLGQDAPVVVDLAREDPEAQAAVASTFTALRTVPCNTLSQMRPDGVGTSRGLSPVTPSREPPWGASKLAAAARHYACASPGAKAIPLAWAIIEDDRPLRNHMVVMFVEHGTKSAPLFTVVAMYRHATNDWWNVSRSFHDPSRPYRRFTIRPTTADLDAFIDQAYFQFDAEHDFRVLAGNVLDDNWREATGEDARRRFPEGIEQPN